MALMEYTGLDWRIAFTAIAGLICLAALVYSRFISQGKWFPWVSLGCTGMIIAALWLPGEITRTVLMDAAALTLAALVWSQDRRAGRLFLAAVLVGSILVAAGMALGGLFHEGAVPPAGLNAKVVIALLLVGYAIKLAAIPFSFWLAPVSERSSTMTAVLVISLLDMAELGELAAIRSGSAWIFANAQWIWTAMALLSMFAGALLALAQTNVRRMLAFSTIDDIGYLLLGLAAGSVGGVLGAAIGALSHSLCKFLLFGAVGVAEDDLKHPLTTADRGLAGRHPVAGAAFIAGALGMIGIPPFLGFLGRWRLYFSGLEAGGTVLIIAMAFATALALLYYVRVIHKVWLGRADEGSTSAPVNYFWIGTIFVLVIILMIIVGLFPSFIPGMAGGAA